MTDNKASTHPLTPWVAADYAPMVTFSGANKLAASGVAPLVALARGYETLELTNVSDFAKHHGLGSSNAKQHSQVLNATRRGDVMVLHWYRADLVAEAHTAGRSPISTSLQLRPESPRENPSTGKLVKYENLTGSESVIDTNPGTPAEWFTSSPKLLITEGVLKGDSALTALLRANGVSDEDLTVSGRMARAEAISRLHTLMMGIPQSQRVTILSFVGVGNWKGNDVWVSLKLNGRKLLLAFDGDIDSNWNVWSQANNLWAFAAGRNALVKLVDLNVEPDLDAELAEIAAGGVGSKDKVGIDDFLVRHGDWNDILERVLDELPDAPARSRDDAEIGTWKVSEDGTSVQEYVAGPNNLQGVPGPSYWKMQVNIGGRVAAVEEHRAPTDIEVETAVFGAGVQDEDVKAQQTCRIELKWINDDSTPGAATITGPATLLMYPPADWDKRGAAIPNNLLLHSEWPPRKGQEWLAAIKDNNENPPAQNTAWTTMGYVPVENSSVCSYISGHTVISPTEQDRLHTIAGVRESVLPGSSKFSLPDMPGVPMSPEWQDQVREDLAALYDHYIELAPWNNINVAGVIIAAGLRPSVPIPCTTNLYVQGPPGQGKSWSVAQIMAFHQARKTWNNKSLPGSMKDTGTSVEQAIAQTNIWVMDDLAPSPDKKQNDMEQSKIGDIMRNVHNRTSKRRSGTELKAREMFTPKALLITTAENEHTINSVRDRAVILNLDKNSLREGTVDIMNEFRDNNRAPGRLMRASVEAIQFLAVQNSWGEMLNELETIKKSFADSARKIISRTKVDGKSDTRHVDMAVDLMLGLAPLNLLAGMVGDERMLAMFDPETKDNLPDRIAAVLEASFQSQGEQTPGRAVLEAIRNLLASGAGHILNASDPTLPPLAGAQDGSNRALGWQADGQGNLRPLGKTIGSITASGKNNPVDVVMLEQTNAFDTAQRHYSSTLPPGTSSTTSFGSVWNEGLIHNAYVNRRDGNRATVVFKIDGRTRRGIPIHLDTLIGRADTVSGEDLGE